MERKPGDTIDSNVFPVKILKYKDDVSGFGA